MTKKTKSLIIYLSIAVYSSLISFGFLRFSEDEVAGYIYVMAITAVYASLMLFFNKWLIIPATKSITIEDSFENVIERVENALKKAGTKVMHMSREEGVFNSKMPFGLQTCGGTYKIKVKTLMSNCQNIDIQFIPKFLMAANKDIYLVERHLIS